MQILDKHLQYHLSVHKYVAMFLDYWYTYHTWTLFILESPITFNTPWNMFSHYTICNMHLYNDCEHGCILINVSCFFFFFLANTFKKTWACALCFRNRKNSVKYSEKIDMMSLKKSLERQLWVDNSITLGFTCFIIYESLLKWGLLAMIFAKSHVSFIMSSFLSLS